MNRPRKRGEGRKFLRQFCRPCMPILGVVFKKNNFSHKLCITLTSFCYLARMQINYLASYEELYDIKILKLYQYLYMHSLYKSTWKEWQGNITIRDEFRLRGLKSLARIFFPLLARKSSGFARILPDLFYPKIAIWKILGGLQPPSAPWAVRLCRERMSNLW